MPPFFLLTKNKTAKENKKTSFLLEDVFFDKNGKIIFFAVKIKKVDYKNKTALFKFFHGGRPLGPEFTQATDGLMSVTKDLLGAGVFSESGVYFGRVWDADIETTINRIENIMIAKHFWEKFFQSPLIINISQIIEFKKKKVIVKETLIKELQLGCQRAGA